MCVVFISSIQHQKEGYRLILASNRDEFYCRPTLSANYWLENSNIIGRDISLSSKGGTWLALNIKGKICTLLNIFQLSNQINAQSRGRLVENYIKSDVKAPIYVESLKDVYNGFKLIMIEINMSSIETYLLTNDDSSNHPVMTNIPDGVKGYGNEAFQKVSEGEKRFNTIVKSYGKNTTKLKLIEELLDLLKWNEQHVLDENLIQHAPKYSGIDYKYFSSVFVEIPHLKYGTRTHTIILIDHNGDIEYNEWTKVDEDWKHQCFNTKLEF
ncbi:transport and Golgi organization 2 homolog isoform X2 [Daktulosphaira vitifoliae]|uniref:transport and Golgi organization 2 homolog isoform X2 n=1 Tax=Daktulosphaira vitifoliae TaxID=58002 RepID=UPI0021AA4A3B|nr:transport and Golgi organization 2 homolog isoform X2 [Daktulosphaira vitifoliae]